MYKKKCGRKTDRHAYWTDVTEYSASVPCLHLVGKYLFANEQAGTAVRIMLKQKFGLQHLFAETPGNSTLTAAVCIFMQKKLHIYAENGLSEPAGCIFIHSPLAGKRQETDANG